MIPKLFTIGLCLFISYQLVAQKPAYVLYDATGNQVNYQSMLDSLEDSDIALFGEIHDNPISHWLQYEVVADMHERRKLLLGAEMIETDNQDELDLYLIDSIDYKALDTLARLWNNYKTDYAPLIDFAKEHGLPFVATNVPRRYANQVYKGGFEALDTLSEQEKQWIAPLPISFDKDLPTYQDILEMMGDHGTPELVKAQAIKDATMAHFILQNYKKEHLFIHFNGAFHSNYYEGILWYLHQRNSELSYLTITTVSQEDIDTLLDEHIGKADFIICVDSNMTTTY